MTNLPSKVKASLALTMIAGTVVALSQPAQAFNITEGSEFSNIITFDDIVNPLPTTVNGYTSGIAAYSANPTGNGQVVKGTVDGQYRTPFGNGSQYLTVGTSNNSGSTTISFSKKLTAFGLQWGSLDTYNSISFFNGGSLLGNFTGTNVVNALGLSNFAFGGAGAASTRYVRFSGGGVFDRVVLTSTSRAFESDNHSFEVVPTPALLPGLIGMGVAALRRKKSEEAVEENA